MAHGLLQRAEAFFPLRHWCNKLMQAIKHVHTDLVLNRLESFIYKTGTHALCLIKISAFPRPIFLLRPPLSRAGLRRRQQKDV
jgi:hypothetical protein